MAGQSDERETTLAAEVEEVEQLVQSTLAKLNAVLQNQTTILAKQAQMQATLAMILEEVSPAPPPPLVNGIMVLGTPVNQ